MTTKEVLPVEKMFGGFEDYSTEELEEGVGVVLAQAFDTSAEVDERMNNLETYLAMMYFLYKKRVEMGTDLVEQEILAGLRDRFSRLFKEGGMDRLLLDYCLEQAVRARRLMMKDKEFQWTELASVIATEVLSTI